MTSREIIRVIFRLGRPLCNTLSYIVYIVHTEMQKSKYTNNAIQSNLASKVSKTLKYYGRVYERFHMSHRDHRSKRNE